MSDDGATTFDFRLSWGMVVFLTLAFLTLVGGGCYTHYREQVLESQAPLVETCVKHRVTQHVVVSQ
jgi:hypothetical protein